MLEFDQCPTIAPFFGFLGVVAATVFSNIGAAYGTAKAGIAIMIGGISSPDMIWKNLIPIIMAGVNGIYGLIIAVILKGAIVSPQNGLSHYSLFTSFAHLAAGFCCGLACLASGMAIGIAGDAGVRSCCQFDYESKKYHGSKTLSFTLGSKYTSRKKNKSGGGDQLFVAMVLIQVFAGNLALYGLITGILLTQTTYTCEY